MLDEAALKAVVLDGVPRSVVPTVTVSFTVRQERLEATRHVAGMRNAGGCVPSRSVNPYSRARVPTSTS
jgi:hypothetical protein